MQNRIFTLIGILVMSFALAACGGTPSSEATAAPETNETNTEAEGGSSTELLQSASVTDAMSGSVTVSYPDGWTSTATDGAGTILLTSSDAGEAVTVTFVASAMATAFGEGPSAVLSGMSDPLVNAMPDAEAGEVSEVTVGGNPAATRTVSIAGVDTIYYVVSTDGGYAFVYGVGVDAATVEAIAASVTYAGA